MFKTLTLVTAFALGAIVTSGPASADYEFDSSGAPVNMHLVPAPVDVNDIYASADRHQPRTVAPFTAAEKALFERTTIPYDSY
jgi:hypothetical protein